MSSLTFKFESDAFEKAKTVISKEYNKITVKTTFSAHSATKPKFVVRKAVQTTK